MEYNAIIRMGLSSAGITVDKSHSDQNLYVLKSMESDLHILSTSPYGVKVEIGDQIKEVSLFSAAKSGFYPNSITQGQMIRLDLVKGNVGPPPKRKIRNETAVSPGCRKVTAFTSPRVVEQVMSDSDVEVAETPKKFSVTLKKRPVNVSPTAVSVVGDGVAGVSTQPDSIRPVPTKTSTGAASDSSLRAELVRLRRELGESVPRSQLQAAEEREADLCRQLNETSQKLRAADAANQRLSAKLNTSSGGKALSTLRSESSAPETTPQSRTRQSTVVSNQSICSGAASGDETAERREGRNLSVQLQRLREQLQVTKSQRDDFKFQLEESAMQVEELRLQLSRVIQPVVDYEDAEDGDYGVGINMSSHAADFDSPTEAAKTRRLSESMRFPEIQQLFSELQGELLRVKRESRGCVPRPLFQQSETRVEELKKLLEEANLKLKQAGLRVGTGSSGARKGKAPISPPSPQHASSVQQQLWECQNQLALSRDECRVLESRYDGERATAAELRLQVQSLQTLLVDNSQKLLVVSATATALQSRMNDLQQQECAIKELASGVGGGRADGTTGGPGRAEMRMGSRGASVGGSRASRASSGTSQDSEHSERSVAAGIDGEVGSESSSVRAHQELSSLLVEEVDSLKEDLLRARQQLVDREREIFRLRNTDRDRQGAVMAGPDGKVQTSSVFVEQLLLQLRKELLEKDTQAIELSAQMLRLRRELVCKDEAFGQLQGEWRVAQDAATQLQGQLLDARERIDSLEKRLLDAKHLQSLAAADLHPRQALKEDLVLHSKAEAAIGWLQGSRGLREVLEECEARCSELQLLCDHKDGLLDVANMDISRLNEEIQMLKIDLCAARSEAEDGRDQRATERSWMAMAAERAGKYDTEKRTDQLQVQDVHLQELNVEHPSKQLQFEQLEEACVELASQLTGAEKACANLDTANSNLLVRLNTAEKSLEDSNIQLVEARAELMDTKCQLLHVDKHSKELEFSIDEERKRNDQLCEQLLQIEQRLAVTYSRKAEIEESYSQSKEEILQLQGVIRERDAVISKQQQQVEELREMAREAEDGVRLDIGADRLASLEERNSELATAIVCLECELQVSVALVQDREEQLLVTERALEELSLEHRQQQLESVRQAEGVLRDTHGAGAVADDTYELSELQRKLSEKDSDVRALNGTIATLELQLEHWRRVSVSSMTDSSAAVLVEAETRLADFNKCSRQTINELTESVKRLESDLRGSGRQLRERVEESEGLRARLEKALGRVADLEKQIRVLVNNRSVLVSTVTLTGDANENNSYCEAVAVLISLRQQLQVREEEVQRLQGLLQVQGPGEQDKQHPEELLTDLHSRLAQIERLASEQVSRVRGQLEAEMHETYSTRIRDLQSEVYSLRDSTRLSDSDRGVGTGYLGAVTLVDEDGVTDGFILTLQNKLVRLESDLANVTNRADETQTTLSSELIYVKSQWSLALDRVSQLEGRAFQAQLELQETQRLLQERDLELQNTRSELLSAQFRLMEETENVGDGAVDGGTGAAARITKADDVSQECLSCRDLKTELLLLLREVAGARTAVIKERPTVELDASQSVEAQRQELTKGTVCLADLTNILPAEMLTHAATYSGCTCLSKGAARAGPQQSPSGMREAVMVSPTCAVDCARETAPGASMAADLTREGADSNNTADALTELTAHKENLNAIDVHKHLILADSGETASDMTQTSALLEGLQATVASQETALEQKAALVEGLQATVASQETALEQKAALVEGLQATVASQETALEQKAALVEGLERDLSAQREEWEARLNRVKEDNDSRYDQQQQQLFYSAMVVDDTANALNQVRGLKAMLEKDLAEAQGMLQQKEQAHEKELAKEKQADEQELAKEKQTADLAVEQLTARWREAEDICVGLRVQLETLTRRLGEHNTGKSREDGERAAYRSAMEARISSLTEAVARLEAEKTELLSHVRRAEAESQTVARRLSDFAATKAALESTLEEVRTKAATTEDQLTSVWQASEARCADLDSQLQSTTQLLEDTTVALTTATKAKVAFEQKLKHTNDIIDSLTSSCKDLDNTCKGLEIDRAELQARLDETLRVSVERFEMLESLFQSTRTSLERRLYEGQEELQLARTQFEDQLNSMSALLDDTTKALSAAKKEKEEVERLLESTTQQLKATLQAQSDEASAKYSELYTIYEETVRKLQTAQSAIADRDDRLAALEHDARTSQEAMDKERLKLEARTADWQAQYEVTSDTLQHTQARLSETATALSEMTRTRDQLDAELEDLRHRSQVTIEQMTRSAQAEIEDSGNRCADLQRRLNEMREIRYSLKEQLRDVEGELTEVKDQLFRCTDERDSALDKVEELTRFKREIVETNSRLAEKVAYLVDFPARVEQLEFSLQEANMVIGESVPKSDLDESQQKCEELEWQLESLKGTLNDTVEALTRISDCEDELQAARKTIEARVPRELLEESERRCEELSQRYLELQSFAYSLKEQADTEEERIAKANAEVEAYSEALTDAQSRIDELQEANHVLQQSVEELGRVQEQLYVFEVEVVQSRQTVEDVHSDMEALKASSLAQEAAFHKKLNELNCVVQSQQERISMLSEVAQTAQHRSGQAESRLAEMQQLVVALEKVVVDSRLQNKELEDSARIKAEQFAQRESSVLQQLQQIEALANDRVAKVRVEVEQQLTGARADEIQLLRERVTQLEQCNNELTADISLMRRELSEAKRKCDELEGARQAEAEKVPLEAFEEVQRRCNDLQRRLNEMRDGRYALREELKEKERALDDCVRQLDRLRADLLVVESRAQEPCESSSNSNKPVLN